MSEVKTVLIKLIANDKEKLDSLSRRWSTIPQKERPAASAWHAHVSQRLETNQNQLDRILRKLPETRFPQ